MRCESKGGAIMGKETVKNTYVLQEDENISLELSLIHI